MVPRGAQLATGIGPGRQTWTPASFKSSGKGYACHASQPGRASQSSREAGARASPCLPIPEGPLKRAPYIGRCETSRCGTKNVVVTGATTHCHVAKFADPISIKAVSHGEVEWRLDHRRYLIHSDSLLLLPDGDEYSLTIDSVQPSRGFCVLFRRGLVEECWRAAVSKHETLLNEPHDIRPLPFRRRLESRTGPLGRALDALAAAVAAKASADTVGWLFEALGERAAESVCEQRRERYRLTAIRPATRLEIHRRLELAREAMEENLASPWTLVTMARAAMMSPHHFHRCFHLAFGETPRSWLSRRRRAERAMALLRGTSRPIIEICLAVGYASSSSFSASFAARYGTPPSQVGRRRRALR
jgi:AraC family transcriptional regulator